MVQRRIAAARARRPNAKSRCGKGSRARVESITFKQRHAQWREGGPQDRRKLSRSHNAANPPPPGHTIEDEIPRVGGRVHWLVRGRDRDMTTPPTTHLTRSPRLPRRHAENNPKRGSR